MAYGDKLVHSSDPCAVIRTRIEHYGSMDALMVVMFDLCSYDLAREWSVQFAHCFGLTQVEFMKKFYALRRVASLERTKAASSASSAERQPSSDGNRRSGGIANSADMSSTKSSGKG